MDNFLQKVSKLRGKENGLIGGCFRRNPLLGYSSAPAEL